MPEQVYSTHAGRWGESGLGAWLAALLLAACCLASACAAPLSGDRVRSTPLAVTLPAETSVAAEGPTVDLILVDAEVSVDASAIEADRARSGALTLEHCATATYDGERLFLFLDALPDNALVFLARYEGISLSGGDNTLFRFLEPEATLDMPLALDGSGRFYTVVADSGPTVWLWQGEAVDGGVVTTGYAVPAAEGSERVPVTERHTLIFLDDAPVRVMGTFPCE